MVHLYRLFLFFSLISSGLATAQKNYNALIFEGNQAFRNKDYEGSSSKFGDAARQQPNDFAAHYNLGNSFYKRKLYAEAEAEYAKAENLAKTREDKAAATYNRGNALMQAGRNMEAAEFYKKALKMDQFNEAARKNYQIAIKKQEQKQQKNKPEQRDQDKSQDNQNGDSPQDGKGQTPQDGGENGGENGRDGNGRMPQNNGEERRGMPKELEDQLLNRAGDKERETARKILNNNAYSAPRSRPKDW